MKIPKSPKKLKVEDILARSKAAQCGTFEKEIDVKSENLKKHIKKLKEKGYMIVGTSYGKTPSKKLWYIKQGLAGL